MILGSIRWIKISKLFNETRTDVQCRERYVNILNPQLKKLSTVNTEEEYLRLVELYVRYGPKWAKISKEMGDRTDNLCKRTIKSLKSKGKLDELIKKIESKSAKKSTVK